MVRRYPIIFQMTVSLSTWVVGKSSVPYGSLRSTVVTAFGVRDCSVLTYLRICRDVRKVTPLLDRLEASQKSIQYLALDLSRPILEQCITQLSKKYHFVRCAGLWGTFADAIEWASRYHHCFDKAAEGQPERHALFFLSLGSIYGNDKFESAVEEFRRWSHALRPKDRLLIGVDANNDPLRVWRSYHDAEGTFERFMRNALDHSNDVLGHEWYRSDDWKLSATMEPDYPIYHRFEFHALRDVRCDALQLELRADHVIKCYEVFKNGPDVIKRAVHGSGLQEVDRWTASSGTFRTSSPLPQPR